MILFNELSIKNIADVLIARKISEEFAEKSGFDRDKCEKIKLISTELANNLIIHHANDGKIRFCINSFDDRVILNIASIDHGPGIKNLEDAVSGRLKSTTGLGKGLAGIFNLSDYVSIISGDKHIKSGGTVISCCFLNGNLTKNYQRNVNFFCISRPWSFVEDSGDILIIDLNERFLRVVVVDLPGLSPEFLKYKRNIAQNIKKIPLFWGIEKITEALPNTKLPIAVFRLDVLNGEVNFFDKGDISSIFIGDDTNKLVEQIRNSEYPLKINKISIERDFVFILHTDGQKTPDLNPTKSLCLAKNSNGIKKNEPDVFILANILFEPKRTNEDATLMVIKWNGKKSLPDYML